MFRLLILSKEGMELHFDRWRVILRWHTWSIESSIEDCIAEATERKFVKYRVATFDYQPVY